MRKSFFPELQKDLLLDTAKGPLEVLYSKSSTDKVL